MSAERVSEKDKTDNKDNESRSLSDRLEMVRKLISNQYGVVHHAERYVFDLAKIASIVLGVISFVGIPQLLFIESGNRFLDALVGGIVGAMILYALVCFIVIMIAIWSIGGINLRLKGTFKPSLWWYSDERLSVLRPKQPEEEWDRIKPVYEDVRKQLCKIPDEEIFEEELSTLLMLYIRTDTQLRVARRMRKVLVTGLFFALGGFIAALLP